MHRAYTYFIFALISIAIMTPVIIFTVNKAEGNVLTFHARPENDSTYLSRYYQVRFRSVDEIYSYMLDLVQNYSFFCELNQIGHTSQKGLQPGFPVYLLKISSGFPKPIILIIGGVNANDWQSTTAILYVANQLLANCSKAGLLITTYDWHFIPIMNPEGYNYSRTTPAAAQWIKNIARWSMDYVGVNLDYNFGYHWKTQYNFHEDTFAGLRRFSEEESKILRDYILRVKNYIELIFILKSPTNTTPREPAITYPWSYTPRKAVQWVLLEYLSVMGAKAANLTTGTQYKVIQSGRQALYIFRRVYTSLSKVKLNIKEQHGKIDDWLFSVGITKVLTIQTKFVADMIADPYESIITVGAEVFAIVKEICIVAFYQPMSYRKTHKRLRINEIVSVGTVIFENREMPKSGTLPFKIAITSRTAVGDKSANS